MRLVKEEGPGLTREGLDRVLGRFTHLGTRPTAGESSSGMGLAIVKQIVERHGGAEFWFGLSLRQ